MRDADSGGVRYINFVEPEVPFDETGTPTWDGLPLDRYLSLLDMLNPMHRLWSDGRWNKLTVAQGCYWKKCSFCDVSLDYISRFEQASADDPGRPHRALIVQETGQTGFHFVDEAAPPKALRALAAELQRRQVDISWWGNVRFEKTFTPALCEDCSPPAAAWRSPAARGGIRPPAQADEEGCLRRAGGAGDAGVLAGRHIWCTPT